MAKKQTDTERMAKVAGKTYTAWLKANKLRGTSEQFFAFIAGWTLCDSDYQRKLAALSATLKTPAR